MNIGFIGLGQMGFHMARRLIEAGHRLIVYDTRPEAMERLAARGAGAAASPREVADQVETVLASLPTPDVVLAVAAGADGVAEGTRVRRFIDLSTTGAVMAARIFADLQARNIVQIDSPVSGGVSGAEKGTLAVMASGPRADVDAVEPILKVFGKVFFIGEQPGAGQTMKLANNVLSATAMAATSEAFVMGVKAGLDPRVMKDVNLCLAEAKALGAPMEVITAVARLLQQACDEIGPEADLTTIVQPVERRAGVEVRAKEGNN